MNRIFVRRKSPLPRLSIILSRRFGSAGSPPAETPPPIERTSQSPSNHPIATNILVLLVGLLLLILYATYETHLPNPSIAFWGISIGGESLYGMAILAREIGFALIVAVTLNFSIEAFNRRRHAQEKKDLLDALSNAHEAQRVQLIENLDNKHKNHLDAVNSRIFEVVYQRNVPEVIFREVENQLLRCPFVRLKSEFTYVIARHDEHFVSLVVRHVYTVENIAPTKEVYALTISFDVIKALSDEYEITRIRHDNHELGPKIKPEISAKSETHDWWQAGVKIPMESGQIVECEIEYRRISPANGKEVICTLMPVKELTVRVMDPKAEFSFRAMALHPRTEKNRSSASNPYESVWQIDGALFPGQGILFDWLPRAGANGTQEQRVVSEMLTNLQRSPKLDASGE